MAVDGTWNIVMKTPMGDREAVIVLKQEGDDVLVGEMSGDGASTVISEGKIENGRWKWQAAITSPMPLTLEFDVEEKDGALEGSVKLGMFGNAPVTGSPA